MRKFKDALLSESAQELDIEIRERIELTKLYPLKFYFIALFVEVITLEKKLDLIYEKEGFLFCDQG